MAAHKSVGSLKEADLKGKRVFVRVDLNVPLDDNFGITDDTRIRAAVPTINYLIAYGAKVILASHLGHPKGVTSKYSLKPLVPRLSELLGVEVMMANDCIGEEVEKLVASLPEGGVLLLENVRFYKEEEKNDPEFAKKLASLADLYVNDAFGAAHRAHASTEGVAKYLKPAVAGFLMQKELDYLIGAVANPKKPFAAILGGSKVSTKISVIESLLDKVDILLLGGGMIFTFYKALGHSVGSSLVEEDMLDLSLSLIKKAKAKGVSLLLPSDVVVADKFAPDANSKVVAASRIPDGWMGLDIGPDAIKSFFEALDTSKTIIWNGPMGVFEFDKFATGTEAIAKKLAELSGNGVTTIIGDGEYVAAMEKVGFADKMSHISTGRRRKEIEDGERQGRKKGEMVVTTGTTDGEQKVLAAAQHILKSLNSSANINTDDMILLFSSIDSRFANLSNIMQTSSASAAAAATSPSPTSSPSVVAGGSASAGGWDDNMSSFSPKSQAELQLEAAEELIHRWDSNSEEFGIDNYFQAVDYLIQLMEDLGLESVELERVENALQLAMSRLEEEFRHTLIQNTVPLDVERIDEFLIRCTSDSSSSTPADGVTHIPALESSSVGVDSFADHGDNDGDNDEGDGDGIVHRKYNRHVVEGTAESDELFHDLVNPNAILDLKGIADRMIRAGYEKECCQVYSSVRRDVLDECMSILGVEKLSIEDVQRIEWKSLDEKMKKWIHALKILVRILLTAEKCLCEEIFSGLDVIEDVCFIEATKGCVMQLLNFGEAVAIGRRSSEKLFRILDMYDALKDVLPDLKRLFSDKEVGDMVYSEAQGVLDGLGEAAIGTFVEFENAVQSETSRRPIQNGEIHPLTRYVMNYVKLLVDYSDTLNALLKKMEEGGGEDANEAGAMDAKMVNDDDNLEAKNMSPIGLRLLSLIMCLESNLEEKSSMYEDEGLKFVFLMNNILYIVQKVLGSDLAKYLGDDWIRKRRGQIRKHATSYLRASWSKVLSCLKDEGIGGSSSNASKVLLKERFKNFNACFEDIYRIQTAWKVPDLQLRDELKISISEKLIPAYRSFMGRFGSHLEGGKHAGKYIKYTSEDLENYLSHLFEGVPLILHHMRRKSS